MRRKNTKKIIYHKEILDDYQKFPKWFQMVFNGYIILETNICSCTPDLGLSVAHSNMAEWKWCQEGRGAFDMLGDGKQIGYPWCWSMQYLH